ncbi:hypothetical protein BASA81_016442 [Batrachochytrium salamandrivorans]|nr:hypothetical protein BASA81_016442 [Batrachochytrium salamandrivorans]
MDLHLLVHSVVLQKVFVLESDWPLIIADFLAGENNIWMDDIPDDVMDRCKKELKNFRFRDNRFPPDLGRRQVYCSLCLHRQKGRYNESLPHFTGSSKVWIHYRST